MLLARTQPGLLQAESPATKTLINDSYALVAVVPRQNPATGKYLLQVDHLYFVDTESPGYRAIACNILCRDSLTYADRDRFLDLASVPLNESSLERSDCPG